MKTYAWVEGARRYIKEMTGLQSLGVCLKDEPGIIEFAIPVRFMLMASDQLKTKLGIVDNDGRYTFERTAHYIADDFFLENQRKIRLQHQLGSGSMRATITLIDDYEAPDDLGGSK